MKSKTLQQKTITTPERKNVALVAHDNMKPALIEWAEKHKDKLIKHNLMATGTTGNLMQKQLNVPVQSLISGPLGGDQQLGGMIAEGKIDVLIFFWDPFEPMPHDPDIKALLRVAAVWNIPIACSVSSANFLVSSPLFESAFERQIPDYEKYLQERL
ncbi:methylglyoxal synthase [Marinomonas hwangdonensis]|uniref:Methylglyoxal synthase n=1 Tax=Marinomonas hwangdonensis TaxID=1053647 RepID=A0A3M8PYV3_9GAMM|nr:methylglyoxal synthase [Marinomonas hwangdonensis]MDP5057645.1 methylglyoxal synthase [Marinomonas hwangdonensis]RNF49006.1 methylglyoxal synthase [Marinomonas hwangdonensis]